MALKYTLIDSPDDCTTKVGALKQAGITGILRYDDPSNNPNSWKQIGAPEYHAIVGAGLMCGIVSEWANTYDGYFSTASGSRDAQYSLRRCAQRGQPKGSAVYFTVDYDVQPLGLVRVSDYFRAVKAVFGSEYRVGVYGSGLCCSTLKAARLVDLTWITCSSGFTGSRAYVNANLEDLWQVFGLCDQTYMGLSVDWNVAKPDWGQVHPPSTKGRRHK